VSRGQQADGVFVVAEEVGAGGCPGKEWALKLFDLNVPERKTVFGRESDKLKDIEKLRGKGQGTFPHIIQPQDMFEDAEGWGCIIMPHAEESLQQRM
jgi:hypothetical protein